MTRFPHTRLVLDDAIAARVFPGAIVEVGGTGGPIGTVAAGRLGYDVDDPAVDAGTIYDLASLTKVIATTTLAVSLVHAGRLDLADPVRRWIPAWAGSDRQDVTVRHLLDHSSGLPAHRRYYEWYQGRAAFERAIAADALEYAPGSQSVYSDLGFILLGFALETAAGRPLDQQFDAWRATALGEAAPDHGLPGYRPPPSLAARVAPTEDDPWRGRVLRGEVHDENAAALGGVAAHAGLFGTAAAVGACARWWLHALTAPDDGGGIASVARAFVRPTGVPGSSRALGWDTMRPTSSCGSRMSAAAVGHTGFTGTSLWIDPAAPGGRYVAVLSNRVHPSRAGDAITRVRQAIHDAVAVDLGRA